PCRARARRRRRRTPPGPRAPRGAAPSRDRSPSRPPSPGPPSPALPWMRPPRGARRAPRGSPPWKIQSPSPTPPGEAVMDFEYSKKTKMYMEQVTEFMAKHIYPNEQAFRDQLDAQPSRWAVPPIMEELKAKARERGLWNLFLPESELGAGLT